MDASGTVNNTPIGSLPGLTGPLTVLGGCPGTGFGSANFHKDWGFWDFAPGTCNQPITIKVNAGNSVIFTEACGTLYPQTIAAQTFTDQAAPVITAPNVTVTGGCTGANVNFSVSVVDDCDPEPRCELQPQLGFIFPIGVTTVTVTATDNTGKTSVKTFTVTVVASDTSRQPSHVRPTSRSTPLLGLAAPLRPSLPRRRTIAPLQRLPIATLRAVLSRKARRLSRPQPPTLRATQAVAPSVSRSMTPKRRRLPLKRQVKRSNVAARGSPQHSTRGWPATAERWPLTIAVPSLGATTSAL